MAGSSRKRRADGLDDLEPLLSGYRPLPGNFDEMMDRDGRVREHWRRSSACSPASGGRRSTAGSPPPTATCAIPACSIGSMRIPAGAVRPWPLSHVPLLIDAAEWQELKAGLVQRAELLEAILADIYGPANLVREGRLPAAVVAGNPEFLRPLVGVAPPGGAHLRFYAVDVGRAARRRWWVLGDRTQAPSGAGYALENRLALSRAMPDIYRALQGRARRAVLPGFQAELVRAQPPRRFARLRADAGADERDLFRARLSRALSRLSAGRRRGPDGPRRRRLHPHRVRPASAPKCCCAGSIPISPIRWS